MSEPLPFAKYSCVKAQNAQKELAEKGRFDEKMKPGFEKCRQQITDTSEKGGFKTSCDLNQYYVGLLKLWGYKVKLNTAQGDKFDVSWNV